MAMPEAFVRAVGANWLVNVAIFMALSSRSAIGKLGALLFLLF
jgi:formate/nitrite transporter FocA (FNT family)